eukprot:6176924-Pleurochrysis_carterae.AAC.1
MVLPFDVLCGRSRVQARAADRSGASRAQPRQGVDAAAVQPGEARTCGVGGASGDRALSRLGERDRMRGRSAIEREMDAGEWEKT